MRFHVTTHRPSISIVRQVISDFLPFEISAFRTLCIGARRSVSTLIKKETRNHTYSPEIYACNKTVIHGETSRQWKGLLINKLTSGFAGNFVRVERRRENTRRWSHRVRVKAHACVSLYFAPEQKTDGCCTNTGPTLCQMPLHPQPGTHGFVDYVYRRFFLVCSSVATASYIFTNRQEISY